MLHVQALLLLLGKDMLLLRIHLLHLLHLLLLLLRHQLLLPWSKVLKSMSIWLLSHAGLHPAHHWPSLAYLLNVWT